MVALSRFQGKQHAPLASLRETRMKSIHLGSNLPLVGKVKDPSGGSVKVLAATRSCYRINSKKTGDFHSPKTPTGSAENWPMRFGSTSGGTPMAV